MTRKTSVCPLVVCALVLASAAAPRALVVLTFFNSAGVDCQHCDEPYSDTPILGAPVRPLIGARWVLSPSGRYYAGGIKSGDTVRFHLDVRDVAASGSSTHFLVTFTTAATGGRAGSLHVRDTSPGARGEIVMIGLPPTPAAESDTNLVERVYRMPDADPSHPLNSSIDFALTVRGLETNATWGIAAIVVGVDPTD